MASQQVSGQAPVQPVTTETATDDFKSRLTGAFRPRTDLQAADIRAGVERLAREAMSNVRLVSSNAMRTMRAMIAETDRQITEQLNLVMHHPDFQRMESGWRGLHFLVNNSQTDTMLQIRVLNISKKELGKVLEKFEGTLWDQSPIFKKVYTAEFSQLGGHPYGCLVGDYYFDNSPSDVMLLGNMANICAAAHVPFISAAAPSLFRLDDWQTLMEPIDLSKRIDNVEYTKWSSLRASEDSRYIGLTLPRVLARLPYGAKTKQVEAFDFEEDVSGKDHARYCWMNAAYAMAVNINRSYTEYGWCTRIRGVEAGGTVSNLPVHTFLTDETGVEMKCPTELAIDQRRESELARLGLMPLIHRKNTDQATFIGAQSLQKPKEFYDDDASANANVSARLPYLFAACRFAHYLKKLTYDKVGTFKEAASLQKFLQGWINNYVDNNPDFSSDVIKAQRPLRAAEVTVEAIASDPGYYNARFSLRPHIQLEGVNIDLSLVSRLPSERVAG